MGDFLATTLFGALTKGKGFEEKKGGVHKKKKNFAD